MVEAAHGKPDFTVGEVSRLFFARSAVWLRNRLAERRDVFAADRTDAGHRRFGLHQIEQLAHLLLQDGMISAFQFAMTIRMVKASALMHQYEIGDTGFLLKHWNGAVAERRQVVTEVMDALEHFDAGRAATGLVAQDHEHEVLAAALAIRGAEQTLIQGRTS
jgi:hypothetical protein